LPMINLKLSMLFCLSLSVFSLQAQNIHWLQADFAPCHIPVNSNKAGYCDLIDQIIIDKLPEYSHTFELSTLSRYVNIMQTEVDFCTSDLLRSAEREKYLYYSKTRLYVLPNGVIAREGDSRLAPYVNEQGEVDFEKLLRSGLSLGLNEGRFYGAGIDAQLKQMADKSPIVFIGSELKTIQMLIMNRFDYSLANPTEIGLFEFNEPESNKVVFYPIAGRNNLLSTHISCRKSVHGEQVINKIDQRLSAQEDAAIIEAYLSWVPERQHPYYYKMLRSLPQNLH
jgi:uncharacterized protein (TIGR02285 family)